jgi:hypothetical protein
MVTAVISDLHLGARSGRDLVRHPKLRSRLLAALAEVDHLVLLGDSIELRDGSLESALGAAAPTLHDLGEAMAGRRLTVVPGNHDHALAAPWLRRRGAPLGLEQISAPERGDPLERLARSLPATELTLAYPGLWLGDDLYATHGHYLDCHNQVRTFECTSVQALRRMRHPGSLRSPDDYEAVVAPLYGAIDRLMRLPSSRRFAALLKQAARPLERLALKRSATPAFARRPGLDAMRRVIGSLGIEAGTVLFGHLHRMGRWPHDGGPTLVNTGTWLYEPRYATGGGPYWPGAYVLIRDSRGPELRNLLSDPESEAFVRALDATRG